jgi:hypothetical protein
MPTIQQKRVLTMAGIGIYFNCSGCGKIRHAQAIASGNYSKCSVCNTTQLITLKDRIIGHNSIKKVKK